MKLTFHHVGFATENIKATLLAMKRSGGCKVLGKITEDPNQNCMLQMVRWNGLAVELIKGLGPKNPVKNILEKGCNIYHACFETDDLEAAVSCLKKEGWVEITPFKPSTAFKGKRASFLFHATLGTIELLGK